MARLTISEAARVTGVARSTLQRAIRAGRLSLAPDHTVDTAELLRAGYTLHAALPPQDVAALQDAAPRSREAPRDAAGPSTQEMELLKREIALLERERDLLRATADAAAAREQVALEREARLLHLLEQAQAQSQRLLEAPRAAPSAATTARAPTARGDPHAMRRRILEVLQAHPEGLHHTAIAQALGVESNLGPTLRSMLRDGLVRRIGPGAYTTLEV